MQWGWGQKQRGMSIWQIIKRWLGAGANPDRQALPHAATTPATAAPWRQWHSPQPSPALRRVAVIDPAHGPLSGDARTLAQALAQLGLQMAEASTLKNLQAPCGLPWARILEEPLSPDAALLGLGALGKHPNQGENPRPPDGPWQLR